MALVDAFCSRSAKCSGANFMRVWNMRATAIQRLPIARHPLCGAAIAALLHPLCDIRAEVNVRR
jgi:hypothetical protein